MFSTCVLTANEHMHKKKIVIEITSLL